MDPGQRGFCLYGRNRAITFLVVKRQHFPYKYTYHMQNIRYDMNWVVDNLIAEILFGVILIGLVSFGWRYFRDGWRAIQIFRIISIHNNETRTRRKGIHARDRFMDIYEAKREVVSRLAPYNTGFIESVFYEQYIDKGILELHGLVNVKETRRGTTVEAERTRVTQWVYKLAKWMEDRERRMTEDFVTDKSGKRRKLPLP